MAECADDKRISKTKQEKYHDLAKARVTSIAADEINPYAGPAVPPLLGQYDSVIIWPTRQHRD